MNKKVIYSTVASSLLIASSSIAGEVSPMVVAPEPASTGGFETGIGLGYHSKYMWRGLNLGKDMVDAYLETSGSLAGLDLTAGVWHAHSFDQATGANKDETDLYVEAAKDLGFATASVGYIFYAFNNTTPASSNPDDAQEVYFGLSKDIAGISTSLTYYWDIETDNNGYVELGLEKSVFGLDAGLTVGYLVEEGELSHTTATVSKSFEIGMGVTASPYVSYIVELDDLETLSGGQGNELIGGVGFSYTF